MMTVTQHHQWTIEALSEQVEAALAEDYSGQRNGQISEVPNQRTIRYYSTLGLLDRPVAMKGRTALYGPRHLLQLVAIKRLLAEGLTLDDVQARLSGLTTRELAEVAQIALAGDVMESLSSATPARRAGRFWGEDPAAALVEAEGWGLEVRGEASKPGASRDRVESDGPLPETRSVQALTVAPGLILLIETGNRLSGSDLDALKPSLAALVRAMTDRGLLPRPTTEE
jgi:DNA-binding transcriptional MerR regulator